MKYDRRSILISGCLAMSFCFLGRALAADRDILCAGAAKLKNKTLTPDKALISPPNLAFDSALRRSQLKPLADAYKIRVPTLNYFDDIKVYGTKNAVHIGPILQEDPSEIFLGGGLVSDMLKAPRGDLAVLTVLAHECAHAKQLEATLFDTLYGIQGIVSVELHADFLAGAYISQFRTGARPVDLDAVVSAWNAWDVTSASHGNREHRLAALSGGYKYARNYGNDWVKAGYDYVRKL